MAADQFNILFCGIGGQGILKASEILCLAAMYQGFHVKKSEVHGMAQRGGSVQSHARFGKKIFSPLIPRGEADFLLSFNIDEHEHMSYWLKKNGTDLWYAYQQAIKELDDLKFLNTYILGVLSTFLSLDQDHWEKAIAEVFPGRLLDMNLKIFKKAAENNFK